MKIILALAWALTLAAAAQQPAKKIPVEFSCTCDDPAGQLFSTAFRDVLADSPRFVQVPRIESDGGQPPELPNMKVSVASVEDGNGASAFSLVYLVGNTLVSNDVRICGTEKAANCAAEAFAALDKATQWVMHQGPRPD